MPNQQGSKAEEVELEERQEITEQRIERNVIQQKEKTESSDSDVDHEQMLVEIKKSIAPHGLVKKLLADSVKLQQKNLSVDLANLSSFQKAE